ncbi:hypothetical protein [Piscirickettsia salmonis]
MTRLGSDLHERVFLASMNDSGAKRPPSSEVQHSVESSYSYR